ncbi:hypothetical protein Bca4012_100383 [Brassica carinata]
MESTFEEEEQTYDEMQANQMEEDESDLDILLVMLNNIATAYVRINNRKQRPVRRPITNIGYDYIQNALKEDPEHFRSLYHMYPSSFEKFCDLIRMKTGLRVPRIYALKKCPRFTIPGDVDEAGVEPSSSFNFTRGGRESKPPIKYQSMK